MPNTLDFTGTLDKVNKLVKARGIAGLPSDPNLPNAALNAGNQAGAALASTNYVKNKALELEQQKNATTQEFQDKQLKQAKEASTMSGITGAGTTYMLGKSLGLWGKDPGMPAYNPGPPIEPAAAPVGPAAPSAPAAEVPILDQTAGVKTGVSSDTVAGAGASGVSSLAGVEADYALGLPTPHGPAAEAMIAESAPIEAGLASTGETASIGGAAGTTTGGAGSGVGAMLAENPVALPAAAGYMAPKLLDTLHGDSNENIGHNLSLGLIKDEGTAKTVGSGLTGAAAGALTGAALTSWSGPGAIVGAGVGALAGAAGAECIIISSCTSPYSLDVDIARRYRDRYLTKEEVRGYYILAEKVVPFISRHPFGKKLCKRYLVDNLIKVGRYALYYQGKPGIVSMVVTKSFLMMCKYLGKRNSSFTRSNGEVV